MCGAVGEPQGGGARTQAGGHTRRLEGQRGREELGYRNWKETTLTLPQPTPSPASSAQEPEGREPGWCSPPPGCQERI